MKYLYSNVTALTLIILSMATANAGDGNIIPVSGVFEAKTDQASDTPSQDQDEHIKHAQDNIDNLAAKGSDGDVILTAEELKAMTDKTPSDSSQKELIEHAQDNIDNPAAQTLAIVPVLAPQDVFSHTVLLLLDNPRKDKPWSRVITSQEEWETFFNEPLAYIDFFGGNAPVAPQFDFEKYQILTGGLGIKRSPSFIDYILSVEKVTQTETEIVVHILNVAPSGACLKAIDNSFDYPNYPATAVLVKKTDKPFRFEISNSTTDCPALSP